MRACAPSEKERTEQLFAALGSYNVTEDWLDLAGSLKNVLGSQRLNAPRRRHVIAATAIKHDGLVLVTENRRDFPMPEIKFYPSAVL